MAQPVTLAADLDTSVVADLRALSSPGENVLAEVVNLFLEDATTQLSAMAAAIGARNAQAVRRIAHRLKGSALSIGAVGMASTCGTVESAAREEALDRAAAHAADLIAEFESTRLALEREMRV